MLYKLQLKELVDYHDGHIALITFEPKVNTGNLFRGSLYLDVNKNTLLKLSLEIQNTQKEFLISIQDYVSIDSLHIKLELNYNPKTTNLQSIIFDYTFRLSSNPQHPIRSKALIAFYDYNIPFSMPISSLVHLPYDYQRILSYPYNDIFWTQNYYIPRSKNRIDFTNYFKTNGYLINHDSITRQSRYIQSPFLNWSRTQRLAWGDIPVQPPKALTQMDGGQITIHYQSVSADYIKGHLFLDYETVDDTTHYYSRASIDRSMSFLSRMQRNVFTLIYLNIFFDLHEIHRRQLIQKLNTLQIVNRLQIEKIYTTTIQNLNHDLYKLKKENKKECNAETLKNMNILIEKELGINNFILFGISNRAHDQE